MATSLLDNLTAFTNSALVPARGPPTPPRVTSAMASSGLSVLHAVASTPFSAAEQELISPLLSKAGKAPPAQATWEHGWYRRKYDTMYTQLKAIRAVQRQQTGRLNIASLLHSPILGADLLLHASGRPLQASDLPGLRVGTRTVEDMIEFHWINHRTLGFRLRDAQFPFPEARSFRLLCDTLVICYPDLLLPHAPAETLTERSHSTDIWILRREERHCRLVLDSATEAPRDLGTVSTIAQAEALARATTGRRRLQFDPHPWLSPILPLWGSTTKLSRKALRASLSEASRERVHARHSDQPDSRRMPYQIADALAAVSWQDLHSLPHSSSRQRLTFYRIKGPHTPSWCSQLDRPGCPHCPDSGHAGGSMYHIYWLCPIAQAIWKAVRSWWQAHGLWTATDGATGDSFLQAIFSLQLPHTPPKAWDFATLHRLPRAVNEDAADPYPVFQAVWQQIALESMVFLLSWRRQEPTQLSSTLAAHALAVHAASCHQVLRTLAVRLDLDPQAPPYASQLVWELTSVFQHDTAPPPASTPTLGHEHILFFDGGSRGNPGPGGSGSVLVTANRLTGAASVRWSSATSLASPRTTNNQAEYLGLIRGLQAATKLGVSSLTVIGDSALIIR